MSFLVLHEDNYVKPSIEGWDLSVVKNLYKNDQSQNKKDFYDTMKAIYYIYNPSTILKNKSKSEKIKIVNEKYLIDNNCERLFKKKHAEDVIELYIDLAQTINQRLWEKVKQDATDFMGYLTDIPFVKQIEWSGDVIIESGKEKKVVKATKTIDIVNMEEKKKAMDIALALSKLIKQIEENLKQEESEDAIKKAVSRMFDKRSENNIVEIYN